MSVLDKDCFLGTEQAVTASAGTTDYFALGSGWNAPGANMYMVVECTTTADSSTDAAVVTYSIQVDDNTSFSSPATLVASPSFAIGAAELTAGGKTYIPIPYNTTLSNKYLRGYVTAGTENLSAGKFTTYLTTNPPRNL